ncbi:bacillithiol biosynthesis cysteine-adding enzyme BshC [Flavobacterium silvaticum]|uniref:Putative cysteine ligase BshC n=1 Tax=Flavobacterium silvaticum TaxID=1852020 RepID=A0A972FP57_9FLAO|nr:bacillithiol biosynthesis cysteine-adding enzyme BshC [Flavobacterium silvaticum]NMH29267.1 bacillithiol biosynthesis cysteine-adding enzyme BshC [Flavobacterium silvaticum]
MPSDCISYQDSGYFTQLITDYLDRKPSVSHLSGRFPEVESFRYQVEEKKEWFTAEKRSVLVASLRRQYEKTDATLQTRQNLESLINHNTFTVTTGHQLNLFTGPLYFLYKIVTVINLSKKLKAEYPENEFVPVYWMATEDHDFEEINYFNFKGKKFRWNRESSGAVGRLTTKDLESVFELFSLELGISKNADALRKLFTKAYLENPDLARATRWLANELFGEYGLVIIDGDDTDLKREFIPYMQNDLENQTAYGVVNESIRTMKGYTVQVNPREINLFYLDDGLRERIVEENDGYRIFGTNKWFSKTELRDELMAYPEKFSPNVIMRPLYQEVILPNLAYIGGGGEIAYWLELKAFFESQEVPFPIVMVRNSVLVASEKQHTKLKALHLNWPDLFLKRIDLENKITKNLSEFPVDLSPQKKILEDQFAYLFKLADQTDPSFSGAVKAQEKKQLHGLDNLEKRLLKAQRRKFEDHLERVSTLQDELFPNRGLQERQANFSQIFIETGSGLIPKLIEELDPFSQSFAVLVI